MRLKVLRIKLHQNKAHYRKEESLTNKMSYPLPPYSTVIGALHKACGYTEYHPMDISIAGNYQSMQREVYKDIGFLNSVMDDRGLLVKLKNPEAFNEGYHVIAKALRKNGNSFRKRITIEVKDEAELAEFNRISELRKVYDEKAQIVKKETQDITQEIQGLKNKLKGLDKKSTEYEKLQSECKALQEKKEKLLADFQMERDREAEIPYSYYANVTSSVRYYEVLYGVDLFLHIHASEEVLQDIYNNIHNLTAIGRSEDFVDVQECRFVDCRDENVRNLKPTETTSYVSYEAVKAGLIKVKNTATLDMGLKVDGTTYYLNKKYTKNNKNQRVFEKVKTVYLSNYSLKQSDLEKYNNNCSNPLLIDEDGIILSLA